MEALTFKASADVKVATLYEQLNSLGDTFQFGELTEEKFKILLLALSMHGPEHKQKREIVFKSMAENSELTFANISQLLQAHEDRSANIQLMQEPEQLQVVYQNKQTNKQFNSRAKPQKKFGLKCSRCNSEKHARNECPFIRSTCFKCGKNGHISNACKSKQPNQVNLVMLNGIQNNVETHRNTQTSKLMDAKYVFNLIMALTLQLLVQEYGIKSTARSLNHISKRMLQQQKNS